MQEGRHEELRELLAPYVLGALTEEEEAPIRSHLLACEECMAEADRYAAAASALALTVDPEPLPEGFADRVMAQVASERPATVATPSLARRLSPVAILSYAALLLLVAVLGVALVRVQQQETREQEIVQALVRDDGISLGGPDGAIGKMVATSDGGLFVAAGLQSAPDGRTYQLWLIDEPCPGCEAEPVSAGTFEVSGSLAVLETDRSLEGIDSVAVTIEPEGGSEQPTTKPVIRSV
ncbi:anti-sigma factor [soil metagenome]